AARRLRVAYGEPAGDVALDVLPPDCHREHRREQPDDTVGARPCAALGDRCVQRLDVGRAQVLDLLGAQLRQYPPVQHALLARRPPGCPRRPPPPAAPPAGVPHRRPPPRAPAPAGGVPPVADPPPPLARLLPRLGHRPVRPAGEHRAAPDPGDAIIQIEAL